MEILGKLFGSLARVRILRLFLFNPGIVYERKEVAKRAKTTPETAGKELTLLRNIKLIRQKKATREIQGKKRTIIGWALNEQFKYLIPLQNFLIHAAPVKENDIVKKFKGVGTIKLLLVTGVFIRNLDTRIDILIVGDNLHERSLERAIRGLEADLGREVRYASFSTDDFRYRMGIYDRLVRDIFDYPYHILIDKIGIERSSRE
ncbi:MAG: hypothetical protein WDZ90_01780 [Candidatus Paceibacterota bacterium]